MNQIFEKLNKEQQKAVLTTEGPVMVIAGAGSGKTSVLTHRIAYLIYQGVKAESILAVTFTNKAAAEMKDRVMGIAGPSAVMATVSTFHSFCARVLRSHIEKLGYRKTFQIIDDDDVLTLVRQTIKELNFDNKKFPAKMVKNLISREKNGLSLIELPIQLADYKIIKNRYQQTLFDQSLVDFDDLIILVLRLFKTFPDVLLSYQTLYRYLLIDEFQDTNDTQYALVSMLANVSKNLFIVGDQDQSIYAFRGANYGNIDKFARDFPDAEKIILEQNYRSTPSILQAANQVIVNNTSRIEKHLRTDLADGDAVYTFRASSDYEEVHFVIQKIEGARHQGISYDDIAVLYRNNALSRLFEEMLLRRGIPYVIYGGVSFFSRREIKDILAYCRLLINPEDDFSLKRVINVPKRGIGLTTVEKLEAHAYESGFSLMNAIDADDVPKATKQKLLDFKTMIMSLSDPLETMTLPQLIPHVMRCSGYDEMLKLEGDEGVDRLDNLAELKSVFRSADEFHEGTNREKLMLLLNDLALKTDQDMDQSEYERVKLMTYHQAKGLEFDTVFLVAMEEGIFPSPASLYNPYDLEEERRVAYVGITRAKRQLFVSSANSRMRYGEFHVGPPSRFIKEMNLTVGKGFVYEETKNVMRAGDKINHKEFGDGVVVGVDGDYINVAFSVDYGIKKLMMKHPSIRKI